MTGWRILCRMASDTSTLFRKAVESSFDEFLARYGFVKTKSESGGDVFGVTYRNGSRYIHIGGTLHPRDYPHYYYLALGEGSDEIPESDWNCTVLWRIIERFSPGESKRHAHLYDIPRGITEIQIAEKIRTNKTLCETHAADFLGGNLARMKEVRGLQNKDREPYKIYQPDSRGKYSVTTDPSSEELKEKYS